MPLSKRDPIWLNEVAARLALFVGTRQEKAYQIAERIGLTASNLSNCMRQSTADKPGQLIDVAAACELKRQFGLPLDWLYDNDPSGLSARLQEQLFSKK